MNKQKIFYEAPTAEVLVVRSEDSVLQVASPNQVRLNSASSGYDANYDLDEI